MWNISRTQTMLLQIKRKGDLTSFSYRSDMPPSNLRLFLKLKKHVEGSKLLYTTGWKINFMVRMKKWIEYLEKCVTLNCELSI